MIGEWGVIDGEQLVQLVEAFRNGSLSHADWTDHAHLAVGTCYVYEFGPVRGLAMLRDGIRNLNDRHGTPNRVCGCVVRRWRTPMRSIGERVVFAPSRQRSNPVSSSR